MCFYRFAGPCVATVACALHNIPVFARAGSITPTAPRVLNSRQASTEPITLNVFPGSDGTYRLYTDDGASIAYTRGGMLTLSGVYVCVCFS